MIQCENLSLKGVIFVKISIFEFLGFFWIFPEFYLIFYPYLKWQKGGFILHRTRRADVACRADMARGPVRMRHGTQGHVVQPREPTRRLGGAEVARTRGKATQVHADTWVVPRGERE